MSNRSRTTRGQCPIPPFSDDERFLQLANCLPGVFVLYDRHRRIRFINEYGVKTSGLTRKAILGKRDDELFPASVTRTYLPTLRRAVRTRSTQRVDLRIVMPDGRVLYSEVAYVPLLDASGRITQILGVTHDIGDRRSLERELLRAAENEQQRVAQDIHDGPCQDLAAIAFKVGQLQEQLSRRHDEEAKAVSCIAGMLTRAIEETRGVALGLQPVMPAPDGLLRSLVALAESIHAVFHVDCRVQYAEPVLVHDECTANHLYRIAQEAVSNAVRHGRARSITVSLRQRKESLTLSVKNDGRGFPATIPRENGMGLRNMSTRAALMGGVLEMKRAGRRGTLVSCTIPSC